MRIVLFWVRDEGEGPITVKDRRLGTDRRRSRQRTAVVSDVSYATVCLVRHALAGIERATCSTDRLAVWTASCGSLVESVLRPGGWESMCRLMCHCVRHISLDNKYGRSVKAIHSSRSRWTACTELCAGTHQEDRRTARRARWGARTVRGAHGGFGSPPWCGQFPPGLTA